MIAWAQDHSLLIIGFSAMIGYLLWQLYKFRDEPNMLRRILYALSPQSHPDFKYPGLKPWYKIAIGITVIIGLLYLFGPD